MVRIIIIFILLGFCISANSQVSFFCDDKTHSISKTSDYYEEGTELWTGIGNHGIMVYRVMEFDTVLFFTSFGCTQYRKDDKSLTLYIWVDYYYESDCLCAGDHETACRPDSSLCDLKIIFTYLDSNFVCSVSDIEKKLIFDTLEYKQTIKNVLSSNYIKLSSLNKICLKESFQYTYNITMDYLWQYYYELALYFLKTENKKALSKLTHNLSYIIKNNRKEGYPEIVYNINYIKNFIDYVWPLRNCTFANKDLVLFQSSMKKFIDDSY